MKSVQVGPRYAAVVDDDDLTIVSSFRWHAQACKNGTVYAYTFSGPERRKIYMHRLIMGALDDQSVDHINHQGLDNTRSNLRVCNNTENMRNMITSRGTSKYKGVSWFRRDSRWRAYIVIDGRQKHLGYFQSEVDAAEAYNKAASIVFGVFAYLNQIPERSLAGV